MLGIDVSSWNRGITFPEKAEFVIIKVTEGRLMNELDDAKVYYDAAKKRGMSIGFYHFCHPEYNSDPTKEVDNFVASLTKMGWLGNGILCVDMEANYLPDNTNWLYNFCYDLYNKTNIVPVIYTSYGPATKMDDDALGSKSRYPLWVALWDGEREVPDMTKFGWWQNAIIKQYTTNFDGNNGIDGNVCNLTKVQWTKLQRPDIDDGLLTKLQELKDLLVSAEKKLKEMEDIVNS